MSYEANYEVRDMLQLVLQKSISGYACMPMPGDRRQMVIAIRKVTSAHFAEGNVRRRFSDDLDRSHPLELDL